MLKVLNGTIIYHGCKYVFYSQLNVNVFRKAFKQKSKIDLHRF